MTDNDFLASVLSDGREHRQMDIVRRSEAERGCGLTVHSRAADLRKRGLNIVQRSERVNGRVVSYYQLVESLSEREPQAESSVSASVAPEPSRSLSDSSLGRSASGLRFPFTLPICTVLDPDADYPNETLFDYSPGAYSEPV